MITLSDQQGKCVSAISKWFQGFVFGSSKPYFEMSGFAGSGKTSVLPFIIDGVGVDPADIAFMAPTGKASRVMTTKMNAMQINARAKTIHSSIYLPNAHKADVLERQLMDRVAAQQAMAAGNIPDIFQGHTLEEAKVLCRREMKKIESELDKLYDKGDTVPSFSINVEADVRYKKLIIVDEASMVDESMAEDILSFNIPVLAIGDKGQLPPVEGDWGFLTDKSDFALTEIHRQAADNPIIWLATLARKGKALPLGDHGDGVRVVRRSDDDATLDIDRELMVICGTHKKRWTLTNKIRKAAGYQCEGPEEGEPLIICKNSKKDLTLINGDFVESASDIEELTHGRPAFSMKIRQETGDLKNVYVYQGLFETHKLKKKGGSTCDPKTAFKTQGQSEHLDFGHAITCHKSQGSQWDEVVLHDEGNVFREASARWRYTGITRAAKRLTVVV